jgi:hypothetical protein
MIADASALAADAIFQVDYRPVIFTLWCGRRESNPHDLEVEGF